MCILSIDFKEAFDKISHSNLFALLRQYGFSDRFQQRIRNINNIATAPLQINGHKYIPIPIRCSVLQGCPKSMQLLVMCLNPLLCTLEKILAGIQIGRLPIETAAVEYADDMTIFVTPPTDLPNHMVGHPRCVFINYIWPNQLSNTTNLWQIYFYYNSTKLRLA